MHGYVLDARTAALDRRRAATGPVRVDRLAALAARGGMRELVVRAHVHRRRLGEPPPWRPPGSADIDNPALADLLR